jgi:hypothetical protein
MVGYPHHWQVLATPVPREKGIAHFHDVRIWNIHARGAATAFEVDGYSEAPLERFALDDLDIEAAKGGHIYDALGWRFTNALLKIGAPVALENAGGVQGLPPEAIQIGPRIQKQDPSKKTYEEQDKS